MRFISFNPSTGKLIGFESKSYINTNLWQCFLASPNTLCFPMVPIVHVNIQFKKQKKKQQKMLPNQFTIQNGNKLYQTILLWCIYLHLHKTQTKPFLLIQIKTAKKNTATFIMRHAFFMCMSTKSMKLSNENTNSTR